MLAPHAIDIHSWNLSNYLTSFTFAEPFDGIFVFVKLCIGQRKYKQKFTTQGVKDRPTKQVNSGSLANSYFAFLQNSRKNGEGIKA